MALTFTRKAAGEFFDEILQKLAAAGGATRAAHGARSGSRSPRRRFPGCCARRRRCPTGWGRWTVSSGGSRGPFRSNRADGEFRSCRSMPRAAPGGACAADVCAPLSRGSTTRSASSSRPSNARPSARRKRIGARLDAFLDEHRENTARRRRCGVTRRDLPEGCAWLAPAETGRGGRRCGAGWRAATAQQLARWEAGWAAPPEWSPGGVPDAVEYLRRTPCWCGRTSSAGRRKSR